MSSFQTVGKDPGYLTPDSLHLDEKQRVVQINLSAETIRKAPHLLLVPITKIRNQNNIPLMIRIKMTWGEQDSSRKRVIGIGRLNLFPPAQTGIYSRRISEVFEHVNVLAEEINSGEKEVALVFEIASISEKKRLEGIEVVIEPVRWKAQPIRPPISEN